MEHWVNGEEGACMGKRVLRLVVHPVLWQNGFQLHLQFQVILLGDSYFFLGTSGGRGIIPQASLPV